MTEQRGYTGKEMCETIVRAFKTINPNFKHAPKEIWKMSLTGELAHVFELHDEALLILGEREESAYEEWMPGRTKSLKEIHRLTRKINEIQSSDTTTNEVEK